MNNKIVVGIVGCGKQSVKHIPALKRLNAKIVLADVDGALAKKRAEEFGVEFVQSVEQIYSDAQITVVDICTPTPTHHSLIEQAVKTRKHFFCEKPLAGSYDEASKIETLLEGAGLVGMVGYLYRFHPAFEMVRNCLTDATIGKPYFATFRLGGRGSHRVWKHRKEQGGGAINEMMVHMLDLVLWYFGNVTRIRPILCETILRKREIDGEGIEVNAEDLAMVLLETKSGVKVVVESDLITPSYMNYMEVQATNGSIITSILDYLPSIVFCKEPRGTYQTGNNVIHYPKVNLFEKQLEYFINCIVDATIPERNTVRESAYLLKLIDKIRRKVEEKDG
jgi:myo-inositol 2-dehydrogenase / D-chiro-inositol 1-dehydrogenase